MLLRFAVRNYRSLATEQEIVLTASSLDDDPKGLITVENFKHKVLPVVIMYGPNASGKSNLLKALNFMVSGVENSHSHQGDKILRRPYLLGDCDEVSTTHMEMDFILPAQPDGIKEDAIRYTYGFVVSDEGIEEEWLYAYPSGHRQVWFHRNRAESPEFYFGRAMKGQNRVIAELTRSTALFLSSAFANNHQQLSPIHRFITNGILVRLDNLTFDEKSPVVQFLENDDLRQELLGFLRNADTGICEAKVKEESISDKQAEVYKALTTVLQEHYPNAKSAHKNFDSSKKVVQLGHTGKSNTVFFPLAEESRGTLAFLELMGLVLVTLGTGGVLVVDEFDSSLHPILSKQVVSLFNSKKTNPKGAQLIFTTHDASILSRDILRRDQIYFVEKDGEGKSNVYPLSKLKTKKGDNIQKGYLEGRFGAIPFLGDFESLVRSGHGPKTS